MKEGKELKDSLRDALSFKEDSYVLLSNIASQTGMSEEGFQELVEKVYNEGLWDKAYERVLGQYKESEIQEFLQHVEKYSDFIITLYTGVSEEIDKFLSEKEVPEGVVH